jgi:hypothetical protein
MNYKKSLLVKICFSLFFIALLIIHLFSIWKIRIDAIALILLILTIIPWFLKYVESLEISGVKFKIPQMDYASKYITDIKINKGETEIKFQETYSQDIKVEKGVKYLSFRARINYSHEAGAQYLLKVIINEKVLNVSHMVNREIQRKIADGRSQPTFNQVNQSWGLLYSPDFISNYSHEKYKVLNFDPYLFIFNIEGLIENGNTLKVQLVHVGDSESKPQLNSIIFRDLVLF